MIKEYLVFWCTGAVSYSRVTRADVVSITHPPHDEPRGTILEYLIIDALDVIAPGSCPYILGAVEMQSRIWAVHSIREIVVGDGRVASVECAAGGWKVHL